MWYKIEEVSLAGDNYVRFVVSFWGSVEDRFLGLAPFLSNDFLFPSETPNETITDVIKNYATRAFRRGVRGDHICHKIDGKIVVGHPLLSTEGKI